MKYYYLIFYQILSLVHAGDKTFIFLPNLPVGEYIVFFKGIMACSINRNSDIQLNFYLNKTSNTETELRGNVTFNKPFDDTNTYHVSMAVKDSIGGWKDNAFVYKANNACSSVKFLAGPKNWKLFLDMFGIPPNTSCPIPKGVFVSKGLSLADIFKNSNFPKKFFYGTYKMRIQYTDGLGNQNGCSIFVIEIKRPWETT